MTADEAAALLEQHQATPQYQRDGRIFWTCKSRCDCAVPATTVRAATFEAQHQAHILQEASVRERSGTELKVAS